MTDTLPKVRTDKEPPRLVKYPFNILANRGDSIFLAGADAHRVRQAGLSYQRHHPEIAKAGDKFRTFKDADKSIPGVTVYRVAIADTDE